MTAVVGEGSLVKPPTAQQSVAVTQETPSRAFPEVVGVFSVRKAVPFHRML
jgi:hypothetical protein